MKKCALILLLCLPPVATAKKKEVPHAPLPSQVVQAKTVFVVNAGGRSLAFDELYAEMKQWGRYQIVDFADAADLVISLQYWVEKNGSSAVPVTNTYTGSTTY